MNKNEKAQEFSLVTTGETAPETMDGDTNFIVDLTSRTTQYCSMVAESAEDKAILYNAMNNPAFRLGDCINQTINVKDIFVEVVNCTNEQTGEVKPCPRIVLIDDKNRVISAFQSAYFLRLKSFSAYTASRTTGRNLYPLQ